PADVGGGPVDLAGRGPVHVRHAPVQRDGVAAVVAHHALGGAGGAGGVEDVERVGGGHAHALRGRGVAHGALPVEVAARHEVGAGLLALQDHAVGGPVRRLL